MTAAALMCFAGSNHVVAAAGSPGLASAARWLSLSSACAVVFSAQLGVQTLPQLLSGELFPSDVRAPCKGAARAATAALLLAGLKAFPAAEAALGPGGAFAALAAGLAAAAPAVWAALPETKDLGLETVRRYFVAAPRRAVFYVSLDSYERGGVTAKEDEEDQCPEVDIQA